MIILKTAAELERMRTSGRMAAAVRDATARAVSPGMTTAEISDYAVEVIRGMGAESAFFGYHGYPGNICISPNEVVVHGIPGTRRIQNGDLVSLDVGVRYGGFVGDTATTVMVGAVDEAARRLTEATEKALYAGIAMAVAGRHVSDISHAVQQAAEAAGFSVVRAFVGHGIGRAVHEEPQVPNFGAPGRGPVLKAGMTLAIEPMVNLGHAEVQVLDDGWTVVTKDGRWSAHFEHTVAVGLEGAEILTSQG
jgi:methionyl aminopeptidase